MNSRQRRGVILLLLSVLCAAGVFAGVLAVIGDVQSKVGPETAAYEVKTDIRPYERLSAAQFERISVPERWLPETAVTDLRDLDGKIALTPLRKGSLLQRDMIVERPALEDGEQEIAIMIDAATGVAGKIRPGARVNIYATFDGAEEGERPQSKVIVENAEVIDVGRLAPFERDSEDRRNGRTTEAVPITFALGTLDAQRVAYAESFASHVRLALVAPGTTESIRPGDRTYTLDGDK
ncbi:Flp pilus assembly protein CpaB [Streptomyces zingiberis]|uniref:Flp pilus assembly protein CpaB n=1 Tax=Streptomyces zingiberis TaxID=2053010 RepID=A0ABX1BW73_9ACTN|nr:Flp pilus assembly protein CpaB [Streptomyces zingiberis]NJQ00528.1 Flp pilus assembly protein CpaB [Streptomyces zingiberis]